VRECGVCEGVWGVRCRMEHGSTDMMSCHYESLWKEVEVGKEMLRVRISGLDGRQLTVRMNA
jgi:hypothetical protein